MLQLRDNTTKYIILLGALFFLFMSSSAQACALEGHDLANLPSAHPSSQIDQHHVHAHDHAEVPTTSDHHQQAPDHPDCDGECCQLVQADLNNLSRSQVNSFSVQQFSSDWFYLQLASGFYSSFHFIDFAQREIISPPSQDPSAVSSSPISSLNAGRAPPSAVLA